jgi:hypothetical protein
MPWTSASRGDARSSRGEQGLGRDCAERWRTPAARDCRRADRGCAAHDGQRDRCTRRTRCGMSRATHAGRPRGRTRP